MPGGGEYLPPVISEFKADVAGFIRDVEAAKLALRSFKDEAGRTSVEAGRNLESTGRSADRMGQDVRRGADNGGRAVDDLSRRVDNLAKSMDRAKASSGGGGFMDWFNNKSVGLPGWMGGKQSPGSLALGGAVAGPLVGGAAWPIAGALAGAGPGIMGTAAMFPFMKDAMGEVTKAFTTLENQTNSYNAAAAQTKTFLTTDSQALQGYNTLLGQLNPLQRGAIGLLQQQDVQWQNLTPAQQAGIISLRQTNALYKDLPQSMKTELNALLAEQKAWSNLEPAQAQALHNYMDMHTVYDQLRTDAMPAMFQTIAAWEKAAADAMRPLLPLIQAAAKGWQILGEHLDAAFRSQGYKNFIDLLSSKATSSIVSWGTAVGNLASGFGHLFEVAIASGFGDRFNAWLVSVTGHFNEWAHSEAGVDWVNRFMARLEANGPTTMSILGKLVDTLGRLVGMLAANRGTLQILELLSQWMLDLMKVPIVGMAASWLLFAGALLKVASALKLIELASGALAVLRGAGMLGGAAAAAAGAGGAAGGGGAAAAAGGLLARGGAAAGGALGIAGIAAIVTPIAVGLTLSAIQSHGSFQSQMGRQGINTGGPANNPNSPPTVKPGATDAAFRDWLNHWSTDNAEINAAIHRGSLQFSQTAYATSHANQMSYQQMIAVFGQETPVYKNQAEQLAAAVRMGSTKFGQATSEFVLSTGGDLAKLSASVKGDANQLFQGMSQDFASGAQMATKTTLGGIAQWKAGTTTSLKDYADTITKQTQTDYNGLRTSVQQLESDTANHRIQNVQQDTQNVMQAVAQFETDAANHRIVTTQGQMQKVSQDLEQFYRDQSNHNDTAMQQDINTLMNDVQGKWKGDSNVTNAAMVQADEQMWHTLGAGWSTASQQARTDAENALKQSIIDAQAWGQAHGIPIATGIGGRGGLTVATGGYISGPGTGTSDSIPARLSNGEFVVNAQATSRHRELLHAINSGAKGFAAGGMALINANEGYLDSYTAGDIEIQGKLGIAKKVADIIGSMLGGTIPTGFRLQIIDQALAAAGVPPPGVLQAWEAGLNTLITRESAWNSHAINLTDSNAAAGDPSRGLAQTIMSTFQAYHVPGTSNDIYDPVANVAAAIRYIVATYGDITNVQQANANLPPKGYDTGGWLMPGRTHVWNGTGQPEAVFTRQQLAQLTAGGEIHIYIDGREVHATVRRREHQSQIRNGRSTLDRADMFG